MTIDHDEVNERLDKRDWDDNDWDDWYWTADEDDEDWDDEEDCYEE